ncbi:MAG: hypothetical protein U0802_21810 [Candidatus Binatia bacterium]
MNAAHLHLALNHLPVITTLVAFVLLATAAWQRADWLLRVGAAVALGGALLTAPAYLSGEPAEEQIEHLRGVSEGAIERHEDAAGIATVAAAVLGIAAAGCLLRFRRVAVPRPVASALVALALLATALFGRTANLGGEIRHPEIRNGGPAVAAPDQD